MILYYTCLAVTFTVAVHLTILFSWTPQLGAVWISRIM